MRQVLRNGFSALVGGQHAGRGWVLYVFVAFELFDLAFLSCLHGPFGELKNTHRRILAFTRPCFSCEEYIVILSFHYVPKLSP